MTFLTTQKKQCFDSDELPPFLDCMILSGLFEER